MHTPWVSVSHRIAAGQKHVTCGWRGLALFQLYRPIVKALAQKAGELDLSSPSPTLCLDLRRIMET